MSESELQPVEPHADQAAIVDPPVDNDGAAFDDDIEALLRHAETLTEVIASNAGGSPEAFLESIADQGPVEAKPLPTPSKDAPADVGPSIPRDSDESPSEVATQPAEESEQIADDSDPASVSADEQIEAALENARTTSPDSTPTDESEIDAILNEVDTAVEEAGDQPDAAARGLPDLLNDPEHESITDADPASAASAEVAPHDDATPEVLYIPDDEEESAASESEPIEVEAPAPTVEAETTPPSIEPEADAEASAPTSQAEAIEENPEPKGLGRFLAGFGIVIVVVKRAVSAARRAPGTLIRWIGNVLEIVNRPFTGVSDRTRSILGVIAMATLICSMLAWVLPWLLTSNPFERIPTGIVTGR